MVIRKSLNNMKKIAIILATASLACGCTKENLNDNLPGGKTFTATVEQSVDPAATKAAADCGFELLPWNDEAPRTRLHTGTIDANGVQMLWSASDVIATGNITPGMMFPFPTPGSFSKVSHPLVGGAGETTATFSGTLSGSFAYFPDNASTVFSSSSISHTLPNPQVQTASGNTDHIGPHCFMTNVPLFGGLTAPPLTLTHFFTLLQIDILNTLPTPITLNSVSLTMDNASPTSGFWTVAAMYPPMGIGGSASLNTATPVATVTLNTGGATVPAGGTYRGYMLLRTNYTEEGETAFFNLNIPGLGGAYPAGEGNKTIPTGGFTLGARYRTTVTINQPD